MKDLRSLVVSLVIGSFGIAALMGIAALLGAGSFGETQAKILLTTVIVGVESIAMLCFLAVAGRPAAPLGVTGALISLVPTAIALYITWSASFEDDFTWRTFGVTVTVAASIAQACLLLSRRHDRPLLLAGTMLVITVVAVMIIGPILDIGGDADLYWRLFGVVAILDALGTITLIALSVFGPKEPASTVAVGRLSDPVAARLSDVAAQRGTSPDDLVTRWLDGLG